MTKNSKYVALNYGHGTLFNSLEELMESEDGWDDEIIEVETGIVYNRENREEFLANYHELNDVDYQVVIVANRPHRSGRFGTKTSEHVLATFANESDAVNYLDQNLPGTSEAYAKMIYKTYHRDLEVGTDGYESHTFACDLLKNSGFSMIYGMPLTVRDGSFPAVSIGAGRISGYHKPSVDKVADLLNNNVELDEIYQREEAEKEKAKGGDDDV